VSTPAYDPRYLAGLRLYRRGRYWDSHEEWEAIWREATGPERHFYQGLIQLDAAIIHTQRRHWSGVANLLARSLIHLAQCPNHLQGMDVARLRGQLRTYREEVLALQSGCQTCFDESLIPDLIVDEIEPQCAIPMEDEHAAHPLD
jgi:predicted metal-dependent hydrolase